MRPAERPKYGGLNLMGHTDGASPRFGSSYLVLHARVTQRCTLTWGDSHLGPEHVGTVEVLEPLLAALLEGVEATGSALGVSGLDVPRLLDRLSTCAARAAEDPAGADPGRALDTYIEAQVHGDVDLSTDVEALVVDPSFDGTPTGDRLGELSARYGVPLRRHAGFALPAGEVPADFRGPLMVPLARRVDEAGRRGVGLADAAAIGRAAADLRDAPERWQDLGTPGDCWQLQKQLWHVLVRFGRRYSLSLNGM